jgi:hypothetical protein
MICPHELEARTQSRRSSGRTRRPPLPRCRAPGAISASVTLMFIPPFGLPISARFSRGWFPSEKNYLRTQLGCGVPKTLELTTACLAGICGKTQKSMFFNCVLKSVFVLGERFRNECAYFQRECLWPERSQQPVSLYVPLSKKNPRWCGRGRHGPRWIPQRLL